MEHTEILAEINKIFKNVLDNDSLVIKDETQATDIDEWDSLTHIQLVVATEKKFKVRFTSKEIQTWSNVGEMIKSIEQKTSTL